MTTTIALTLDAVEEAAQLLVNGADSIDDSQDFSEEAAAMRYHGLMLLRQVEERKTEVF
jgi:hypothetical protein